MTISLPEWFELDPKKKDAAWADRITTYLRQHMQYLVSPQRAYRNMKVLLGTYDVDFTRDMFLKPDETGINFSPLSVFEKTRNIIASEIEESGIQIQLKAEDPTAHDQKKRDRELLSKRKDIEAIVSTLNAQMGMPPYKLSDEQSEDGEGPFNGDVQSFDDGGYDDGSDEDLNHWFSIHYRLFVEIMAEAPINFFMKFNQVEENFGLWVNDILAKKAIAAKVFVNQVNGAVNIRYVAPETVRTLPGNRRDFQDSPARDYIQSIFVHEFIEMVGDEFDATTGMEALLSAVNFANRQQFTGVTTDGNICYGYGGVNGTNLVAFNDLMQFKIQVGYIEFKSQDKYVTKSTTKNKYGNARVIEMPASYQGSSDSSYKRTERIDEVTYKAVYLVLSSLSQKLYQFGKLNYQGKGNNVQHGMEDEYSNFSIAIYKEIGKTATEVAWPYIRLIEEAFKKFEEVVRLAKPPGTEYSYETLVKLAQKMFPDNNKAQGVQQVMNMFQKSANRFSLFPEIDGQPIGGGTEVHRDLPNGIAPAAAQFLEIVNWNFNEINAQLGISPLRNAYTPKERDTARLQEAAQQSSEKATGYIPRMLMKMLNHCAKRTLSFTQQIIKYRSVNEVAYEFLVRAIGERSVKEIKALENVPLHRFGIFVMSFNVAPELQEMRQMLLIALNQKEITVEQYLLIKSINDPQKAAMVLAYEKRRNERKGEEALQRRAQEQQAIQQQMMQMEMQKTQMEGQLKLQQTQMQVEGDLAVEQLRQQGELAKQSMKINAEPAKIDAKKNAEIETAEVESNLRAQAPMGSA